MAYGVVDLNGAPGVLVRDGGRLMMALGFEMPDGEISGVHAVMNPDKLAFVERRPGRAQRRLSHSGGTAGPRCEGRSARERPASEGTERMTTILVTGGTGTLGRLVTERLRAEGHDGAGTQPARPAVRRRPARGRDGAGRGRHGRGHRRALRELAARR